MQAEKVSTGFNQMPAGTAQTNKPLSQKAFDLPKQEDHRCNQLYNKGHNLFGIDSLRAMPLCMLAH